MRDGAALGKRLRALRLEKDVRQSALAKALGISAAYLNLLEKGKRSMQFPLLLKALEVLAVELDVFMESLGDERPDDVLAHLLNDPLAKTLDLVAADLVHLRAEPKAATTIAALFNLYKNTRAQLETLSSKLAEGAPIPLAYAPGDEVIDYLERHKNYFSELEELACEVRERTALPRRFVSEQLALAMGREYGVNVTIESPADDTSVVRAFDPIRSELWLSANLSEHALKFQLAHVIGLVLIDRKGLAERLVDDANPRHPETARLIKIHLANYFAGALILPYDDFFDEVMRTRYDVEAVARSFETSYEMVAHRMCNLGNPNKKGVPLHFLRVDVGGNISKRYSASGLHVPQGHGTCPKWAAHAAFLSPATVTKQYEMMPDGALYFSFAKVNAEPKAGSIVRGTVYSIGLGTTADHASKFVYADDLPRRDVAKSAVPVGISCRFCERQDCNQRAAPSYKFAFAVDEYNKKDNFFSPPRR